MKKILSLIIPVLFMSCSDGYVITGNAPEGTDSVTLLRLVGKKQVPVQSVAVENGGVYTFKGYAEVPYMAYITTKDNLLSDLCVTNDAISVTAEGPQGSEENGVYSYLCENIDFSDGDKAFETIQLVIKEHPWSTAASYFLFRKLYNTLSIEQIETLEPMFDDNVRANDYLTILRQLVAQKKTTAVGMPMIDFTSKTTSGEEFSLSSLSGKWILLDFWASWCPYCRQDNPFVVSCYSDYHDKGLEILYVSLDNEYDKWTEAIEADKLSWNHVSDLDGWDCAHARLYGVSAIPSNVLIDPSGIIVARDLHGEELASFLSEKLN